MRLIMVIKNRGRPELPENEKRKFFKIRMSDVEKNNLMKLTQLRNDKSASETIRNLVREALEKYNIK